MVVILYQVENELYANQPATESYMQELEAKAKADEIDVPLIGNEVDTFQLTAINPYIPSYDSYPYFFYFSDPSSFTQPPTFSS